MQPLATELAGRFISDFWSANHDITWLELEAERQLWLAPDVLLVGRVDAIGLTGDGEKFFGEWKTASASKARRMEEEKIKWRTNPQALTYGVLLNDETRRFTVRWALKTKPPQTAFEWYTYTDAEVAHWREQLIGIAAEIREWRRIAPNGPWRTNRANCYRYGVAYACPFIESCHALRFHEALGEARVPHLDFERNLREQAKAEGLSIVPGGVDSNVVIIDASRVEDYLECPEAYRRKWEGRGYQESNEALEIGKDFHATIAAHLASLKETPK